jgi:hypothetical protein
MDMHIYTLHFIHLFYIYTSFVIFSSYNFHFHYHYLSFTMFTCTQARLKSLKFIVDMQSFLTGLALVAARLNMNVQLVSMDWHWLRYKVRQRLSSLVLSSTYSNPIAITYVLLYCTWRRSVIKIITHLVILVKHTHVTFDNTLGQHYNQLQVQ